MQRLVVSVPHCWPGQHDGLAIVFLWLCLWVQRPQRQPRLQTVGGAQTRTITLFVLLDSPAIHSENSATHTDSHAQQEYQRVTFCWKNEAVSGGHSSASALVRHCSVTVLFFFFPLLPVLMCDTCSALMLEMRWFGPKTVFCAWKNLGAVMQARAFPPMWTAEYLMQSSVFSARGSFVRTRHICRPKAHQASHWSCVEAAKRVEACLQLCGITEGLSCLYAQATATLASDSWNSKHRRQQNWNFS